MVQRKLIKVMDLKLGRLFWVIWTGLLMLKR